MFYGGMPESEDLESEIGPKEGEEQGITDRIGPLRNSLQLENKGDFPPICQPKKPRVSSGYIRRKSTQEKGQELELKDFDNIQNGFEFEEIPDKPKRKEIAVI